VTACAVNGTTTAPATPPKKLRRVVNLHRGQAELMRSERRFILGVAGRQSGKTTTGPHWMFREIKRRGPGDYLVAAPSYPLMMKKVLPAFLKLFEKEMKLGTYNGQRKAFTFSEDGCKRIFGDGLAATCTVFFGHAADPDSLESATMKAAWLDEAGQNRFKLGSWEAIQGRLAIHQGRVLITTTPYNLGWLKTQFHDRWKAGDPLYDVVRFDSKENPAFPIEEYERARATLPRWKFNMFYRGMFEKPAGLIYDCFDDAQHIVTPFEIPIGWRRYLGLDFGGVNTVGVFIAENPKDKTLYLYREYWPRTNRSAAEHAAELVKGEPGVPIAVGGSASEGQWRTEFQRAGLPIRQPSVTEVEVGIDRVYGLIKSGRLRFFRPCVHVLDDIQGYSRETDDEGEPLEGIADKAKAHGCDAVRYAATLLYNPSGGKLNPITMSRPDQTGFGSLGAGVFNT
jgi:hypothetical protein